MTYKHLASNRLGLRRAASVLLFTAAAAATATATSGVEFRYALDDSALDITKPIKGEEFTDAVKSFHEAGINPYNGNAEAISFGKEKYDELCAACHMPDASGKIGPGLIDDVVSNKRANTDVGKFEVIYSGAAGAMRSFSERGVTQDQILKIIAYVNSLKK